MAFMTGWPNEWTPDGPDRWLAEWNGMVVRFTRYYMSRKHRTRRLDIVVQWGPLDAEKARLQRALDYKNRTPSHVVVQIAVEHWWADRVAKRLAVPTWP